MELQIIHLRHRRRRGIFLAELITALWIVGLLITVFSIALGAERRFQRRINDQMTALRTAESVLTTLQQNARPPEFAPSIHITHLTGNWAKVTVTVNQSSATLMGPTRGTP